MLRFRLAGIPIAVQPWFWALALLLGVGSGFTGAGLAVWVVVVFVCVLVDELGLAVTIRSFGYQPAVLLHMIGGLTSWQPEEELAPARRIVSTLAGPFVGFALAAGAWVLRGPMEIGSTGLLRDALWWTLLVNVVWGVFNLIPIRGLDGGQAVGGFLELVAPRRGKQLAEGVYVLTGVAAIVFGILNELYLLAIFAAVLTFGGMFSRTPRARPRRPAPAPGGEPPKLGI